MCVAYIVYINTKQMLCCLSLQSNAESQNPSVMPSASADPMSVPNFATLWSSPLRVQTSSGPSSGVFRPQMDGAKLEEARVFLQNIDYNRTLWQDDDGDTWVKLKAFILN